MEPKSPGITMANGMKMDGLYFAVFWILVAFHLGASYISLGHARPPLMPNEPLYLKNETRIKR
jgi:hypothetical protein